MHEMSDETLNFRCKNCNAAVPFSTHATNPSLDCSCGTPVKVLQVNKIKLLNTMYGTRKNSKQI